ncbi:condensation domain-containing protein [Catenulispora pinisilvae]|uniref:condensation domain-containing protein n=1 Tax=Catenulispora pinisilvae TaxID=2705253 RepID=UPI0018916B79|nr:condensation domain-containing protein [Catenulispora pinisilvae]
MQHTIMVPFHGEGAGSEELTWGQWTVWRMMNGFGSVFMIGGAMRLEEGTSLEHLKRLLAFIMARHESLRTRIRTEPDGQPRQVLAESGEVGLEVIDIEDGEDPAAVAEATRERYEFEPFDIAQDWPVRMAVIRKDGVPDHFVAMYPHMVIDAYGFDALVGDLVNLDRRTGAELAARGGIQPMELARKQRGASAARQCEASLRYWEKWLREVPARRFNGPYPGCDPRWWDCTYDSRAAFLAVGAISARTGLHSGPVLLTAYAVALERVTHAGPSAIRMVVSNRFRPDFAPSVSVLAQPGLCVFDVRDCTFDEAVGRAWHAQIATGKNAYYDPRKMAEMRKRVEKERGEELDLMLYFNDRRKTLAQPVAEPEAVADAEQLWDALPSSRLTWGIRSNTPDVKAYLDVNGSPDTVNVTLRSDTQALSPSEQVAILRTMEEILLAAAFDPDCPTGV